jgi:C-terminal processing protease CtpA/Prc
MKYACRVLRLLQAGKDPSPPRLSTLFYEDLDDEGKLTVAQTYLGDNTISLKIGDTITAVAGVSGEIRNEGQLVHALRGRLEEVELVVTRAGKQVTVAGRLNPAPGVMERNGVYAAGILFAPMNLRDDRELNLDQPLMVHSVEDGTLGESLEIEKWDMLVSVNGRPVEGLSNLYARLEAADRGGKAVTFVFKRWSGDRDRVYDYLERSMDIDDLEFVGPSPLGQIASRD